MNKKIKLYGTETCPQCKGTKMYLEQKGIPFEYIDVRKDPDGMKYLEELGLSTLPVVAYDNWVVAGFSPKGIDNMLKEAHDNGDA